MAENRAVWGIDIGQAGLKAIRLKYAEQAGQVLAVAFDYIPHPKILSQPDAIPKDLIQQALNTFLERNDTAGDLISISLPGHSALARFIQLPPVESAKVADVVKYEARQQIPFDLEDVIWDFQTLSGGIEESGFMLGAEVGLFAMKNEQVYEALAPFNDAKMEVELVQIAPLGMYNFLCYDVYGARLEEEFAPPEDYTIVLDMGTDNTTLLVTNGEKIWIRNVPIGGNHFTRALTKEMKLTFAKAEHLKCNATKSPDPRAVFQALRPVFNDYVAEIQRSIGYFSSVNREAKISRIVGIGNGFKLAGLQKFLQQNLQYEVERVESFNGMIGDTVLNAPLFQDNIMTFVVPYGLALQTLQVTKIHTSLLPPEIATARKIRRKKPWAVTTAAVLLGGMALSVSGFANAMGVVTTKEFSDAESKVKAFNNTVTQAKTAFDGAKEEHTKLVGEGEFLVKYVDTRELWVEVFRAINEALPRPEGKEKDETDITKIPRINIRSVTTKRQADLGAWFAALPDTLKTTMSEAEAAAPPTGPGYVFHIQGEHFYTPDGDLGRGGHLFVQSTLLANLKKQFVQQAKTPAPVPVGHLGISHPVLTDQPSPTRVKWYPNGPPKGKAGGGPRGFGRGLPGANPLSRPGAPTVRPGAQKVAAADDGAKEIFRTTFTLEFAWSPTAVADRVVPEAAQPPAAGQLTPAVPGAAGPAAPVPATGIPGVAPGTVPAAPGSGVPATGTPVTPQAQPKTGQPAVGVSATGQPATGRPVPN